MPGDLAPNALPGIEQPPGHAVAGVQGPRGVGIACQCGNWSAFVTGQSSARWAGEDYKRHASEVTGGTT